MLLKGSCHCGSVRFSVRTHTPVPYMACYCSICRKTAGGGGFAINLMAEAASLKVEGRAHLGVYRARLSPRARTRSPGQRHFCKRCASALWVADPRWPENVYPFASAIDTPLPRPRKREHIMLEAKPDWVLPDVRAGDRRFRGYPTDGILEWHRRHGRLV